MIAEQSANTFGRCKYMKKAIIGKKVGMTQIFDENGRVIPVTVVEAGPCVVVQKKTIEKDGYEAIQVGFGDVREKHAEAHDDETGFNVEFRHHSGFEPFWSADGVGDDKSDKERPECPFKVTVQGELGTYQADEKSYAEQPYECRNIFFQAFALQFHADGE